MRINLFGSIVANDDAWIYEWFEMEHSTPKSIADQLAASEGEDVELYINSPGGDVWAGSEIYTALREHSGSVTAKVVGIAASAASVAMCGASKVLVSPTAQVMVHRSSTVAYGNKHDVDQTSQMLNSVDEGMVNAYEHKTGKPREELIALMDNETFLNAQDAVSNGFADEIMFAQVEKVAASAAVPLFSNETMNKIKSKLIQANLAPGGRAEPKPEPVASAPTNNETPKEGKTTMTYEELQSQHPELYAQVVKAGADEERSRITALNEFEGVPGAAPFIKAAIENGETAADVAMKIVKASAQRSKQEGEDRKKDAEESGVNAVANQQGVDASDKEKEEDDARVQAMIQRIAAKRAEKKGGK